MWGPEGQEKCRPAHEAQLTKIQRTRTLLAAGLDGFRLYPDKESGCILPVS